MKKYLIVLPLSFIRKMSSIKSRIFSGGISHQSNFFNYNEITNNKWKVKLRKSNHDDECNCLANDPSPCSIENRCLNVLLQIECVSGRCAAQDRCQNQNFYKGTQFSFEIRMTSWKGWGLFTKDEIAEKNL